MATGYMIREYFGDRCHDDYEETTEVLITQGVFKSFDEAIAKCKELAQKRYKEFMLEYETLRVDLGSDDVEEPVIGEIEDTHFTVDCFNHFTYKFSVVSVSIH